MYKDVTARIIAAGDLSGGAYPTIKYKINAESYHVGVMSEDPHGNMSNVVWKVAEKITMKGSGSSSTKLTITDIPDGIDFCEVWLSNKTNLTFDDYVAFGSNTVSVVNSVNTAVIVLYNYYTYDWNGSGGSGGYYIFIEYNSIQERSGLLIDITTSNSTIQWDELDLVSTRFDF